MPETQPLQRDRYRTVKYSNSSHSRVLGKNYADENRREPGSDAWEKEHGGAAKTHPSAKTTSRKPAQFGYDRKIGESCSYLSNGHRDHTPATGLPTPHLQHKPRLPRCSAHPPPWHVSGRWSDPEARDRAQCKQRPRSHGWSLGSNSSSSGNDSPNHKLLVCSKHKSLCDYSSPQRTEHPRQAAALALSPHHPERQQHYQTVSFAGIEIHPA